MNLEVTEQADQERKIPELWTRFVSSRTDREYYRGWLSLQSELTGGVVQGMVVASSDGDAQYQPVAGWPEGGGDPARLSDLVEQVLEERCGLLIGIGESGNYGLGFPLLMEDQIFGAVALETSMNSERELQRAMEQLQWGVAWLELLVRRKKNNEDGKVLHRLKSAVDLLAATLGEQTFSGAAIVFTTEAARLLGCERVSLGLLRGNHIKLKAVSHSAEVGPKMNLTRTIERVMEEAMVQRCEIVYPTAEDEMRICRDHEELSRLQSMASIATVPLFRGGSFYGALTFERAADSPFEEYDIECIRGVASLAGPALENKYENDRPLVNKITSAAKSLCYGLVGKSHPGLKLIMVVLAATICFLSVATGEYRLTADTALEGAIRRAIVVPFDGYVDQATARAGDIVEEGQLLCALDDRDLLLEKLAKTSKSRQMERQFQEAVAQHDRARAGIVKAQLEQLRAEIDLAENRLSRTRLKAPFGGLLVSGDLSQKLGSIVKQGEVLFELTPLNGYRVILKVDERHIGDVKEGQEGTLVLTSLPDQRYPFVVDKITPLTRAEEGRNYFRVEAQLNSFDFNLRPGMEGVGKISVDRRKYISIWTRDLVEWLKIAFWKWLP